MGRTEIFSSLLYRSPYCFAFSRSSSKSILGAFDAAELQAFIKDKEVVSIRDHFFTKDDMPYLAVLVTYQLAGPPTDVPAVEPAAATPRNEKWRENPRRRRLAPVQHLARMAQPTRQ